jgi:hypothetical protein
MYLVEIWEEEKGMETILLLKNKVLQDLEQNEEKMIPRPRLQQNKDKLYQQTQQRPQEHSERRNSTSN